MNEKLISMQDLVIGWQRRYNQLEERSQEEIFQLQSSFQDMSNVKIDSNKEEQIRQAEITAYHIQIDQMKMKIVELENSLENALKINEVVERGQYERIKEISTLKKEKSLQDQLKSDQLEQLSNQIDFLRK